MPFPSYAEYEVLIYSLAESYPEQIKSSTLRLYTTSTRTARLEGELEFSNGLRLSVFEFIDFITDQIRDYSYTVFRSDEKIRWYDPQPHPENPALASTFPHHRHEPPDIKHNRKPAPGISFYASNLPTLIRDCEEVGKVDEANK